MTPGKQKKNSIWNAYSYVTCTRTFTRNAGCQWLNHKNKWVLLSTCGLPHLPSSIIDVWYPCGSVTCKCTLGLSMFSLESVPRFPPSGTGVLKMFREAGWGACGGDGARAFILLLEMKRKGENIYLSGSKLQFVNKLKIRSIQGSMKTV